MQAIVRTQYGSPDVLQLQEIASPLPKDNEVLVRVYASSVNAADLDYLKGTFLIRLGGLLKPTHAILGSDIAGRVEAVGKDVTQFQPGDEVFGDLSEYGFGAFAEYVAVPEAALALKPSNLTFEEAAAVPSAGFIALQGLRDHRQIQPGDRVLINGAGGGAGTFAVQLAKSYGAEVTGVDHARKLDMLRSIGADHVVDYTQADVTRVEQPFDLILDTVAYRSVFDYRRILRPEGAYVLAGGSVSAILQAGLVAPSVAKKQNQTMGLLMVRANQADLLSLKTLLEAGTIVPVIHKHYSLREVPVALRDLDDGLVQGKAVITIGDHQ